MKEIIGDTPVSLGPYLAWKELCEVIDTLETDLLDWNSRYPQKVTLEKALSYLKELRRKGP